MPANKASNQKAIASTLFLTDRTTFEATYGTAIKTTDRDSDDETKFSSVSTT
jgi:hypothetical protein